MRRAVHPWSWHRKIAGRQEKERMKAERRQEKLRMKTGERHKEGRRNITESRRKTGRHEEQDDRGRKTIGKQEKG